MFIGVVHQYFTIVHINSLTILNKNVHENVHNSVPLSWLNINLHNKHNLNKHPDTDCNTLQNEMVNSLPSLETLCSFYPCT